MISILMTSQKFSLVPTTIRSNLTLFITFKLNKIDWKYFQTDLYYKDEDLKDLLNFIFEKPDNFMIYRIDNNTIFKNFNKLLI